MSNSSSSSSSSSAPPPPHHLLLNNNNSEEHHDLIQLDSKRAQKVGKKPKRSTKNGTTISKFEDGEGKLAKEEEKFGGQFLPENHELFEQDQQHHQWAHAAFYGLEGWETSESNGHQNGYYGQVGGGAGGTMPFFGQNANVDVDEQLLQHDGYSPSSLIGSVNKKRGCFPKNATNKLKHWLFLNVTVCAQFFWSHCVFF